MGDAQIVYSGTTITLQKARQGLNPAYEQIGNVNESNSGLIETVNLYDIIKISFTAFFSQATCFQLIAWWAYAKQGQEFAFAFDSTRTASTTLDGAAAAAQKTVPLTATTGISAGDYLLIRSLDSDDQEIIEVDSVSAGVSVTAVANLIYTYASGDTCRHEDYYPTVKKDKIMSRFRPEVTDPGRAVTNTHYYKHTFRFIEAK